MPAVTTISEELVMLDQQTAWYGLPHSIASALTLPFVLLQMRLHGR